MINLPPETFDGCRHDSHRLKVHDPDDQEDRRQTGTAVAAVEAEAPAVSPGRADVGRSRSRAALAGALQFTAWKALHLACCGRPPIAAARRRLAPAGERVARAIGAVVVGAGLFLIARAAELG